MLSQTLQIANISITAHQVICHKRQLIVQVSLLNREDTLGGTEEVGMLETDRRDKCWAEWRRRWWPTRHRERQQRLLKWGFLDQCRNLCPTATAMKVLRQQEIRLPKQIWNNQYGDRMHISSLKVYIINNIVSQQLQLISSLTQGRRENSNEIIFLQ